jgi:hypothetical protein
MQIKKGDRFQISGCLYRVAGYWSHDVVLYPVARDDDEVLVYTPDEIKDEVERGSMLYLETEIEMTVPVDDDDAIISVPDIDVDVINDGALVFSGRLQEFLADNECDDWLHAECSRLSSLSEISFSEFSGEWIIRRKEA